MQIRSAPAMEPAAARPATTMTAEPKKLAPLVSRSVFRLKKAEVELQSLSKAELELTENLNAVPAEEHSVRLGLIARCWIDGNDVHLVDESLGITQHFRFDEPMPEGFEKARTLAANLPTHYCALIVYTDKVEALLMDGSTILYP